MTGSRRGFLALVGGATVTGSVLFRKARTPTLIVPAALDLAARPPMGAPIALTGHPLLEAMAARGKSQMHAFIDVKAGIPDDLFLGWLEGGLRMARSCKPGGATYRAMQMEGHPWVTGKGRAGT